MAISVSCPKCQAKLQAPEALAGKKVKCQACQEVFEVPAPAMPPADSVPDSAVVVEDKAGKMPPKRKRATPPSLGAKAAKRRPAPASSSGVTSVAMLGGLIAVFGGLFVLALVVCGGAAWFMVSPREQPAPKEPVAAGRDRIRVDDFKPPMPIDQGKPPFDRRDFDPARDFIEPRDFDPKRDFFDPKRDFIDPKRDFFEKKEEPKRPLLDDAAQKIALKNGQFDIEARLGADDPLDRNTPAKLFLVPLEANQVYVVEMKKVGNDFFRPRVRVEGPDREAIPLGGGDRFGDNPAGAFIAPKTGPYRIIAGAEFGAGGQFSLRLRHIAEGDALPANISLPKPAVPRHSMALVKKIDSFLSAAIAADSKSAWVSFPGNKLERYSCTDGSVLDTCSLPKQCYQLAIDKRGMLYAMAQESAKREALPWWGLGIADLHIYDTNAIKGGKLTPTKIIPLRGIVYHLYISPDDDWLYYFDSHNRKIGRLNLKTATIDRENADVAPGTKAMCMAPDGKKLYTCAETDVVQVLDAATLKIEKTFRFANVKPNGIQATDSGFVFLNPGMGQWTSIYLVNTNKDDKAKVDAVPWAGVYQTHSLKLAPDQKRLYASCFSLSPSNITSFHISERPALFKGQECSSIGLDGVNARGLMEVSRDGATMFCDRGLIISLGR